MICRFYFRKRLRIKQRPTIYVAENRERVLKGKEMLRQVWGDDDYFRGRSLDVFISKLRKYLREDSSIQIINYHGVGFRLDIHPEHSSVKQKEA